MELAEFERVYDSFCAFHAEFAPDFGRKQWRENSLTMQQEWGKKTPHLTRPQTYRVVRELLPRVRFTPADLLRWQEETQRRNERAKRSHTKRRAQRCRDMPAAIPTL